LHHENPDFRMEIPGFPDFTPDIHRICRIYQQVQKFDKTPVPLVFQPFLCYNTTEVIHNPTGFSTGSL